MAHILSREKENPAHCFTPAGTSELRVPAGAEYCKYHPALAALLSRPGGGNFDYLTVLYCSFEIRMQTVLPFSLTTSSPKSAFNLAIDAVGTEVSSSHLAVPHPNVVPLLSFL